MVFSFCSTLLTNQDTERPLGAKLLLKPADLGIINVVLLFQEFRIKPLRGHGYFNPKFWKKPERPGNCTYKVCLRESCVNYENKSKGAMETSER